MHPQQRCVAGRWLGVLKQDEAARGWVAPSEVHVHREAEVGGADAIGEAVRPEECSALIGHHRELQIRAPLLVGAGQVDVCVGRPVGGAERPFAALPARVLRLDLLHLLRLQLQVVHRGAHLLLRLLLDGRRLLRLALDGVYHRDEARALRLVPPSRLGGHAHLGALHKGRLGSTCRVGKVVLPDGLRLEGLERRLLERPERLHEGRLDRRQHRLAKLLLLVGIQLRHVGVARRRARGELVLRVGEHGVRLGAEAGQVLARRDRLAQHRHLCVGLGEARGVEAIARKRGLQHGLGGLAAAATQHEDAARGGAAARLRPRRAEGGGRRDENRQ
mmetsp:Transcript_33493/g.107659  ORF Transcript_33493/g.107659 Transcript_33493/m.107659 type:complete len:332 (-) Transcript_33493:23-1018(-)